MNTYKKDRAFTDYVHTELALSHIYEPLKWQQHALNPSRLNQEDRARGIDYVFIDKTGRICTVQERFRESAYKKYNDFTIRYRRDGNRFKNRVESEFYKIKADFFTYGITNGNKDDLQSNTALIKFALIDMRQVYELIVDKKIDIIESKETTCKMNNGVMRCPIIHNKDGSSSFFPIDIQLLIEHFTPRVIVSQQGLTC